MEIGKGKGMNKHYCPYCMTPVPEGESCSVCKLTAGIYVPSPHHLPPGTVLVDRYLVGRVLGEGGFGITYIGRDLRLELKVAIKEYYPVDRATRNAAASLNITSFMGSSAASYERGKRKFLDEAQVMAKLDKQQVIVSVRDFFEINNTAYIVMEYIEGVTLHELVEQRGGRIAPDELFPMLEPLFQALSIIHENGLIHRDISPDNLMLESGRIRLLDFGCAREASRGTETMTIALKHGYAPIEQYQQKGQGPWTDLYALCATIYYALTGKTPPQALDRITEDELLLPTKLGVDITPEQEKALLKGMRLQPNLRFASAQELWTALYPASREKDRGREEWRSKPLLLNPPPKGQNGDEGNSSPVGTDEKEQQFEGDSSDTSLDGEEREQRAVIQNFAHGIPSGQGGEDGAAMESDPEASFWKRTWESIPKRFLYVGVGVAACILILVGVVAVSHLWTQETAILNSEGNLDIADGSTGFSRESNPSAVADKNLKTPAPSVDNLPDVNLFENAYRFAGGNESELQKVLQDESVSALILDCGTFYSGDAVNITKPVQVAVGTTWSLIHLTVAGEGYLQVEGELDLSGPSYLRLEKGGTRLSIEEGGEFRSGGLVWMDEESCLIRKDGKETKGQLLVFSEERFEQEDVVEVADFAALSEAAAAGRPVIIKEDIEWTDPLTFRAPVLILEGVTVRGRQYEEGVLYIEGGNVLVNHGTLENVYMESQSALINYGLLEGVLPEDLSAASLWFSEGCFLVNFGIVNGDNTSRLLEDALCVNLGEINAYEFSFAGGNLLNLADIRLLGEGMSLEIDAEGTFLNAQGASVTVSSGAAFRNRSRLLNQGEIWVQENSEFDNLLLENSGSFRAEAGARIHEGGIFCGDGQYDLRVDNLKIYPTFYAGLPEKEERKDVASPEELAEALEHFEGQGICITSDLTLETDLVVQKNIYLSDGCSLILKNNAELTCYGSLIAAGIGSSIQGSRITLSDGAQLYLPGEAELFLEEDGCLAMDGSLLWGREGGIRMNGATLHMKNKAAFFFDEISYLEAENGEILLEGGAVFAVPAADGGAFTLKNAAITLPEETEPGYFLIANNAAFQDCTISVGSGFLINDSKGLSLHSCQLTVGRNGSLEHAGTHARLELKENSSLEVWGRANISGWPDEGAALSVEGSVANYGELYIWIPAKLSEPIHNEGKLYYNSSIDGCELDPDMVEGNAPIDAASE